MTKRLNDVQASPTAAPGGDSGGTVKMPVLFIGHGSPMNAIEDNEFARAWAEVGKSLPRPEAILCVSAHWETHGTHVTAMQRPRTIHDFYGFPRELYDVRYPAPGSAALAGLVRDTLHGLPVGLDMEGGLDHGAWSVLMRLFPDADVPVVQLSLDRGKAPSRHYDLAKALAALRRKGILILGSGNVVHNLRTVAWEDTAYDWAVEFDEQVKRLIESGDHDGIVHYQRYGQAARLAAPTNEHYLPLVYVLALQDQDDGLSFFTEKVTMGSISMRSLKVG